MNQIYSVLKISLLLLGVGLPCLLYAKESIIDAHIHTYHNEGDFYWTGPGLPPNATREEKDKNKFERTQVIWDKHNITTAITSGSLDRIVRWKQADPERIVPGVLIGPFANTDEHFLNRIRSMTKNGDLAVLGELALQYTGIGPDNPIIDVYFSLAEELDIPIALHMGPGPDGPEALKAVPLYRVRDGDPMLLEEALIRHPKMRIYVMHAGWPFLDNMIAIMTTYDQVYVGIGDINHSFPRKAFHHYLKRLVDAGFGKRIMYGSDSYYSAKPKDESDPTYHISYEERYDRSIENVRSADFLSEEQKRDIFFNNAVRFFRLDK